ncbi:MAG: bis(5'-nucleosyl)-tetraphosphatase (symmetrical) YqeK [Bacillaceae bacterium]|nr:bis(5'-nucleosyl)-tetraphosphatase (symmetrical) YqeK [Bacillaceae bacterium]
MNKEEAIKIVKAHLPEKRYRHTLGVLQTAVDLAKIYHACEHEVTLAAIFHDYAKYHAVEEMRSTIISESLDERYLHYGDELLHGPIGAYLVKTKFGIGNERVLNAIRYHTTGRVGMTLVEKIIFIADYIEPGRNFPGVDEVRNVVTCDLDLAVIYAIQNTVQFLMKKQMPIFPDTIDTYNSLIKRR